jgi:G-protein alpha subunit
MVTVFCMIELTPVSKQVTKEQNLDAIVFVTPLAACDQTVKEEPDLNRFVDTLSCFEQITKNILLSQVPIICLLNKSDHFFEKCKTIKFLSTV